MFSAGDSGLYSIRCESVVIENAMDPDSTYFAHGAVRKYGRVFEWNISLIIEPISYPAAQCFRRKPAFVHGNVEWVFVVISARTDRAQIVDKSFAIPESRRHRTCFVLLLVIVIIIEKHRARAGLRARARPRLFTRQFLNRRIRFRFRRARLVSVRSSRASGLGSCYLCACKSSVALAICATIPDCHR